ncbi:DUF2635 domain-containing protein [Kingella kingae]|uniref:hypothetical protein n=1 Tax=Kingella TaxID=32257 RepID=UPI00031480F6|nr:MULTISPECIES: hypothetical protein [Kingella]MDK4527097.1 DUF2635 domain-containing protein [Kingella kingae]MDK4533194.1 DUF2635 domain-containing protein [Kingella kingae]MDK4555635.1 DUF2635 domain-containing protein [Kingella kingae]MDK4584655.1 DUF2635 domain-containing protein [Kingella kingae]MDK4588696.1 DUF2635 domain-containing protein [Kingella kingae]
MNKIKVVAAYGLRVPFADNPHEYIEQEEVEVDGDNVYYRRLLAEGDLLIDAEPQTQPEKKGK